MFPGTTRVLVVDDMMTMRKIIKKSCHEIGLTQVTEAADGQLAWEILSDNANSIDLIISDWNMPNCTGLDLLKRVRADGRLKELPFVLLTAESDAGQVKEAILAKVDNYITKPFNTKTLEEKLAAVHKKKAA